MSVDSSELYVLKCHYVIIVQEITGELHKAEEWCSLSVLAQWEFVRLLTRGYSRNETDRFSLIIYSFKLQLPSQFG